MIIEEWRKFRGWNVLKFFLRTGTEIDIFRKIIKTYL